MYTHDIFQLEDSKFQQIAFADILARKASPTSPLRYTHTNTLEGLTQHFQRGESARAYLVDGKFPLKDGKDASFLGLDAIKMIKLYSPQSECILYTGNLATPLLDSSALVWRKLSVSTEDAVERILKMLSSPAS